MGRSAEMSQGSVVISQCLESGHPVINNEGIEAVCVVVL